MFGGLWLRRGKPAPQTFAPGIREAEYAGADNLLRRALCTLKALGSAAGETRVTSFRSKHLRGGANKHALKTGKGLSGKKAARLRTLGWAARENKFPMRPSACRKRC